MLRNTLFGLERSNIASRPLLEDIVDQSTLGQDFWLPDPEFFEIVTRAVEGSRNPALGLSIGQRGGNWEGFGVSGLYISSVRSFAEAVKAMVRFNRATRDRQDVFLVQDERTLTVNFGPFDGPLSARHFLGEIALAAMCELFVRFTGPRSSPLAVAFDYPEPRHTGEYSKVFGCPVHFDQPRVSLVVSRTLAEREQLLFQPSLSEELGRLTELRVMGGGEAALCIAERVRSCMRAGWPANAASMSNIARELGVSERSLRRHLAREGLDFRSLVAERRWEVAREMLRNGVVVKQVAGELGYRSTSAFHRAFRRWAGSTPVAFAVGERRSQ